MPFQFKIAVLKKSRNKHPNETPMQVYLTAVLSTFQPKWIEVKSCLIEDKDY